MIVTKPCDSGRNRASYDIRGVALPPYTRLDNCPLRPFFVQHQQAYQGQSPRIAGSAWVCLESIQRGERRIVRRLTMQTVIHFGKILDEKILRHWPTIESEPFAYVTDSLMCGGVKQKTFARFPVICWYRKRRLSQNTAVEPLPFVPAMCMTLACGNPGFCNSLAQFGLRLVF